MKYDYSKLLGRIIEVCGTRREFARRMGFSQNSCSRKLRGVKPFKQVEIDMAAELLGIPGEEIQTYFFKRKSSINVNN